MDIDKQILDIAIAARKASNELSSLSTSLKNQVLSGIADALTDKREFLKEENEKDIKDIPKGISKHLKIIPVEHMDEVLAYALIVDKDETLFQSNDMAFEMPSEVPEKRPPLI